MFRRFTIFSLLIFLIFSLSIMFGSPFTFSEDAETDRSAQWYEAQYGTGPLGQTWMMGRFGPDFGIGEQGIRYQS